ncbi:glycosyltransferase family A protein [Luteimicrobium subarcticum]|uniref:Glycosyltransferase involved in cell wall biosynthesis n=1 Tax=Luteimicrobium subarcticum TaxID=620910 RepID=A0A2M8WT39_9MICO|nr:glycosyltransferase family A protein [Luteimicrobium subarcticum]PJI94117.1 glycosyltransferase involved in cell wall biosynthesis [Luteimicrobium subarcticum]
MIPDASQTTPRPLVSIVLPTNRRSPYLRAAVETVANQTYEMWELVIVDNGVEDDVWLTAALDGIPRTRVITTRPATLGRSRNVGFGESRGSLVVFHDDDDLWIPERLALQVESLLRTPDAPACYVGGWHMDASGAPFEPAFPAVPATAADMLRGAVPTPHICGTLMIRRDAFVTVGGFAPELPIMEDFEFMLRLLYEGTFSCVPGEALGYRRHDANMTSTDRANVRARRSVMEQSLVRLAAAARLRGDSHNAELLEEHLTRFRGRAATEAGAAAVGVARRNGPGDAMAELAWGARRAPVDAARGLGRSLRRR